jgi:hypothetical protein
MFFTFTFNLSIMVTLPFKIGSGGMLAIWVSQELEDGFSELLGLLTLAFANVEFHWLVF